MISIYLDGRLGNQMFQYTIVRLIAEKNNYKFFIPNGKYHENDGNPHVWMGENIFDCYLGENNNPVLTYTYNDSHNQEYNNNIFNISDNTLLRGFFQTDKYYDKYEDIIRSWFKFKPCAESDEIIKKYENYCFIHFRGLDYKNIKMFFLPKSYYDDAKKHSGCSKFVIITDDYNMATEYFPDDIILSNNAKIDFNILNKAKNIIISNSSFSWWAAWLNTDNNVIAPNGWFNYNGDKSFAPYHINTNKFKYI